MRKEKKGASAEDVPVSVPAKMKAGAQKRGKRAIAAVCCVLGALLFFCGGWLGHFLSLGKNARSLLWAVRTAEKNFYGDVSEEDLYAAFFDDFALDPYSGYYTREEYAALYTQHAGDHEDYGLQFRAEGEELRIVHAVGNSPAERVGISDGMYLLAFGEDEETLKTGTVSAFRAFVEGKDEIVLKCGFDPSGADASLYRIAREDYRSAAVLYRDNEGALRFVGEGKLACGAIEELPGDTAYLRIEEFYGSAAAETEAALNAMKARGKTRLILDLRSNGGGYLSVFQEIAALLMREAEGRTPIVALSRNSAGKESRWRAPANRFSEFFAPGAEIYLLADENTASASECLIGALLSYGTLSFSDIFLRAETGRTYGKGIMQSMFTDAAGNVLKLTSAQMFWPNGKTIHGVGVTAADGAVPIEAPAIAGAEDVFLQQVCARIQERPSK